jgi:dihydrofolate reductase
MRQLILKVSMTMDGFMAGPNGELDWLFATMSAEGKQWIAESLANAGVHIMGSRTYADMAAYWPKSTDILAPVMNDIPKVVFSRSHVMKTTKALEDARRLEPVSESGASWGAPRVASGDLAEEITRLKSETGKAIIAHGGVRFLRSLVAAGLVDEYQLVVHPIMLGHGQSLFDKRIAFTPVSTTAFPAGTVAHVLRPS